MQNSFLNISIKTLNLFLKKLLAETKLVKLSKDSEKKLKLPLDIMKFSTLISNTIFLLDIFTLFLLYLKM